ncbi:MAG: arsenate reductase ArsC [Candidatus Krumholzibacteriota bacterium]|nr:arsenate reductase ArsC [Candidatus Krumholzibacteriota bacterium]
MKKDKKIRILYLCTGNACRSQMAEGWTNHLKGDIIEAGSAGVTPIGVSRRAIEVMAEEGVDISGHRSKSMDEFIGADFDYVITLCANAERNCPAGMCNAVKIHRPFDDPYGLSGDREYVMSEFRRARDEIRAFVESMPEVLISSRDLGEKPEKN